MSLTLSKCRGIGHYLDDQLYKDMDVFWALCKAVVEYKWFIVD